MGPHTIHQTLSYPSGHPWDPKLPKWLQGTCGTPGYPRGQRTPHGDPERPRGGQGGGTPGRILGVKTVGSGPRSHLVEILVVEQVGLAGLEAVLALALVEDVGLELPAGIVLGGHGAARARSAPAQRPAERPPAAAPIAAAPRPRGASRQRKNQHGTPTNTAGGKKIKRGSEAQGGRLRCGSAGAHGRAAAEREGAALPAPCGAGRDGEGRRGGRCGAGPGPARGGPGVRALREPLPTAPPAKFPAPRSQA